MLPPISPPVPLPQRPEAGANDQILRAKARELEGVFLAEMLRHTGVGKPPEGFGGGIGEDQFTSFLLQAQADAIVRKGGIGLADSLYHALKARADGTR